MLDRKLGSKIRESAEKLPIIVVTGPRQSGKSTLIRALFPDHIYQNLEDPELRQFANSDPKGFLGSNDSKMILDEVQNVPQLLSYIQVITDQAKIPGQFILSGSQNLLLMEGVSQSLAGRITLFNLLPFSLEEIHDTPYRLASFEEYILKGFYPRIYDMDLDPTKWLQDYLKTYVERDVRQLLNIGNLHTFRQFLEICAGRIGQLVNFTEIGNQIGVSYQTVNNWISILETSFVCYTLRPYHKNFNKRIVKSPKLYFYDTGLACALLNLRSVQDLNRHFAKGALFENFIINEVLKNQLNRELSPKNFFWNAAGSREIDLIMDVGGKLIAAEIKSSRTLNSHFFDSLTYFQTVSGTPPEDSFLIYGGDENQKRSAANVINWQTLSSLPY
ncbi:ATP-binding protein [Algoriphagus jejuensis]|uniref:ATP-binding protein n=1 Tax=Algoriphagus jejuensis TaxID=419934 RepID=A0ABP3YD64_9BACT